MPNEPDLRFLKLSLAVLFLLLAASLATVYFGYFYFKKVEPKKTEVKLPLWVQEPEQFLKEYQREQEEMKKSYGIEEAKQRMLEKGFPTRE